MLDSARSLRRSVTWLGAALAVMLTLALIPRQARADLTVAAGTTADNCLSQLSASGEGQLAANVAAPNTPYVLTVPAGLTSLTVVLNGGAGANGDHATGGEGGVMVAKLPGPAR